MLSVVIKSIFLTISLELYLYYGAADEAEHPMWAL